MTEGDRAWIAPMLAADAHLDIRPGAAALLHRHPHQLAHALAIKHLEGILRQDLLLHVA